MNDASTETWEQRIPREQLWPIMSGLLLVMLLASLDQTIVSTALPKVIADLKGFDRYSWVATAYLLCSTVTVPLYGKLSDIFGRKRILVIGVTIFLVGSAVSGAAQTMNELIAARSLQGLGAGALFPIVIATFGDLFSPRERGKWQGLGGAVFGFSSIAGPVTGGWITDHFSWRWVFYVNLPLGIVALAVLLVLMPPLRFAKPGTQIDFLGAGVLIAGLVPLLLAFSWAGSTYAWSSPQVVGLLVWSALDLTAFVLIEMRRPYAVMEPQLFGVSIYSVSILATVLLGAAMFGGIFYIPLFVQGVLGISATNSGLITTPLMIALVLASIFSGQMLSRFGRYKGLAMSGMVIMLGGALLLLRLNAGSHYPDVLLAMLVMGAGLGLGMQLYTTISQNAVPQSKIGQATSGLTFFRQLGATVGLAVMGSLLTSRFRSNLASQLSGSLKAAIPPAVRGRFDNPQVLISPAARTAMRKSFSHFGPRGLSLYQELQNDIKVALANGLHDVFLSSLMLVVLALVTVVFLKEIPLRTAAREEESGSTLAQPEVALGSMPTARTSPGGLSRSAEKP